MWTNPQVLRHANLLDHENELMENCFRMDLLKKLNRSEVWHSHVTLNGFQFQAPSLDRLASLWLHKLGILGEEEFDFFSRVVRPGMTIAEVGANQGIYTLFLARLATPGKVFAFEPDPLFIVNW
jgi:hypothetical protein